MDEISVIDAHAALGEEYHLRLQADELLRRMDAAGIGMAIARPMGAELAVRNREGNDRVLGAGPRIKGLATANPWFGRDAVEELRRCHGLGAVGLFLHPTRQGFMPTDAEVEPLLDFAAAVEWPVMFHTGTYIQSDILALAETARHYPEVSFIAGFAGFTDMWFELPGVFAEVPNMFMDASVIWSAATEAIIRDCGAERVLYGSAEPRGRYGAGLAALGRLELDAQQRRALFCGNARRLFQLP